MTTLMETVIDSCAIWHSEAPDDDTSFNYLCYGHRRRYTSSFAPIGCCLPLSVCLCVSLSLLPHILLPREPSFLTHPLSPLLIEGATLLLFPFPSRPLSRCLTSCHIDMLHHGQVGWTLRQEEARYFADPRHVRLLLHRLLRPRARGSMSHCRLSQPSSTLVCYEISSSSSSH